jgi:hypothetical protein
LRSSELAAYLSLLASGRTGTRPAWQRAFGASAADVGALVEAVEAILDGTAVTREELVADPRFARLEEALRSGWGALLRPLAWQGRLCHGPSREANVTFARPASALPGRQRLPAPEVAAPQVIAAYLGAYGPSTPDLFDAWLTRGSLRKTTVPGRRRPRCWPRRIAAG